MQRIPGFLELNGNRRYNNEMDYWKATPKNSILYSISSNLQHCWPAALTTKRAAGCGLTLFYLRFIITAIPTLKISQFYFAELTSCLFILLFTRKLSLVLRNHGNNLRASRSVCACVRTHTRSWPIRSSGHIWLIRWPNQSACLRGQCQVKFKHTSSSINTHATTQYRL